jgi:hypothetical protein
MTHALLTSRHFPIRRQHLPIISSLLKSNLPVFGLLGTRGTRLTITCNDLRYSHGQLLGYWHNMAQSHCIATLYPMQIPITNIMHSLCGMSYIPATTPSATTRAESSPRYTIIDGPTNGSRQTPEPYARDRIQQAMSPPLEPAPSGRIRRRFPRHRVTHAYVLPTAWPAQKRITRTIKGACVTQGDVCTVITMPHGSHAGPVRLRMSKFDRREFRGWSGSRAVTSLQLSTHAAFSHAASSRQ